MHMEAVDRAHSRNDHGEGEDADAESSVGAMARTASDGSEERRWDGMGWDGMGTFYHVSVGDMDEGGPGQALGQRMFRGMVADGDEKTRKGGWAMGKVRSMPTAHRIEHIPDRVHALRT